MYVYVYIQTGVYDTLQMLFFLSLSQFVVVKCPLLQMGTLRPREVNGLGHQLVHGGGRTPGLST